MIFRNLLALVFCMGISAKSAYAQQTIKIRSGLSGLDVPLSSHRGKYTQGITSNKYFNNYKYKNIPWPDLHAFFEYSYNKNLFVSLGYSNSTMGAGIRYNYLGLGDWPETPETELAFPGGGNYIEFELHRIPIFMTYNLLKIMSKISGLQYEDNQKVYSRPELLGGFSLMIFNPRLPKYSEILIPNFTNDFFTLDGNYVFQQYNYRVWNNFNLGFLAGMNFRVGHRKREIASFTVYYEHGLWNMFSLHQNSFIDNTYLIKNAVLSNGSQVSFRITFPVVSYNFTKKKFYRD
jgi:hypothetical protein